VGTSLPQGIKQHPKWILWAHYNNNIMIIMINTFVVMTTAEVHHKNGTALMQLWGQCYRVRKMTMTVMPTRPVLHRRWVWRGTAILSLPNIPPPNPIYCHIICVVVNTLVMWYSGSSQNQRNQSKAIGLPQEEAGRGAGGRGGGGKILRGKWSKYF